MSKRTKREKDRLRINMQYQVHPPSDEALSRTRSGRLYAKSVGPLPTSRKIKIKDRTPMDTASAPSSLLESSTEGMDSEEGRRVSREVYRRIDELGLNKGRASLDTIVSAGRGDQPSITKESLTVSTRPAMELIAGSEGMHKKTIIEVPKFQEQQEVGSGKVGVHPPQLAGGGDDENLRQNLIQIMNPKVRYSVQSLPDQIRQGNQPEIGGKRVGFVPMKGGTEGEPIIFQSPRAPGADLYLKLEGGVAMTQLLAWKIPAKSPEGNELVEVYIPQWQDKYNTNVYVADTITGQMYVARENKYVAIDEKCATSPIVGEEIMSTTPMAGVGYGRETVDTPISPFMRKQTPPPAESTRKDKPRMIQLGGLGESFLGEETIDTDIILRPTRGMTGQGSKKRPDKEIITPRKVGGSESTNVSTDTESEDIFQSVENIGGESENIVSPSIVEDSTGKIVKRPSNKGMEETAKPPYTSRDSAEKMLEDKKRAEKKIAQEAAAMAAKRLAEVAMKEAMKEVAQEEQDKINEEMRMAQEAIENQRQLELEKVN